MMPLSLMPLLLTIGVLAGAARQPLPLVVFETEKGSIEMQVDSGRAPVTAANFLKYPPIRIVRAYRK
jgi:hypothetical protein